MSSSDEIDVELLILAVKKRACIWNYKLQDYSNKTIKNRAWADVCEEVINNFKDKCINEKNAIGIELQSKWKTLRDGFTRYCRTLKKKSGSAASNVKQYTYYKHLIFLKDVTEDKGQSTSNFDVPSPENSPPTIQPSEEELVKKRPRKRQSEGDDALIKKLTKKINEAEKDLSPPIDEDKSFLLSLVSDFSKIPADWKLDAKLEIIQVIKHYKAFSKPSTSQSSYNSGYSNSTHSARPGSQLTTTDSLSSQNFINPMPSPSYSYNYTGYSTTTYPARPERQLTPNENSLSNMTTDESLSSENSIITDLFSK